MEYNIYMSDSSPEFSKDLQAIANRESIAKSLKDNLDLKQIIKKVKASPNTEEISTKLVSEELFVTPEVATIMYSLQELAKTEFPQIKGLCLVLIGSSAHGGGLIRHFFNTSKEQDIDVAFLHDFDPSITDDFIGQVRHLVSEKGSILSAKKIHATGYHTNNIHSPKQASEFLRLATSQDSSVKATLRGQIPLYFEPSFPDSANVQNRELLLTELGHIYQQNPDLWQQITTIILKTWSQQHHIKAKHLYGKYTREFYESQHYPFNQPSSRSFHLENAVEQQTQFDMLAPMIKLLNQTKSI